MRMTRPAAVLLPIALLAAGCRPAAPPPPPEALSPPPLVCPLRMPELPVYNPTPAPGDLVTPGESRGLVCALTPRLTRKRFLTAVQLAPLIEMINALPLAPPVARPCPFDDDTGYTLEAGTTIAIHAQGCRVVTDGPHVRDGSQALLDELAALTAG